MIENNKMIMCRPCNHGDIIKFFIEDTFEFHNNLNINITKFILPNRYDIVWICVPTHYHFN